jgi:Caudovirus prohead serine protease
MVVLYDDVEPLRVQGYATVWNVVHSCPAPLRLLPGACDHVGLPVYATFGHNPEQEFADARDGSLAIWTDDYGLCFEAALPWSWGGVGLARGIRANNFREVSCCWDHGRWSTFADEAERNVETVRKAKLVEISDVVRRSGRAWIDSVIGGALLDIARAGPLVRTPPSRARHGAVPARAAGRVTGPCAGKSGWVGAVPPGQAEIVKLSRELTMPEKPA